MLPLPGCGRVDVSFIKEIAKKHIRVIGQSQGTYEFALIQAATVGYNKAITECREKIREAIEDLRVGLNKWFKQPNPSSAEMNGKILSFERVLLGDETK